MTVAELRYRMSTKEFTEWIAYYQAEAELEKDREKKAKLKRGR